MSIKDWIVIIAIVFVFVMLYNIIIITATYTSTSNFSLDVDLIAKQTGFCSGLVIIVKVIIDKIFLRIKNEK